MEIHRYRRFKGWDYKKGASLFITIALEPRRWLFGNIIDGKVNHSLLGIKAAGALDDMPRLNAGISVFGRVVMPDHIHFNCAIAPDLNEPLKILGGAIRRFKNYITAEAKRSLAINAASSPNGQAPIIDSAISPSPPRNSIDGQAPIIGNAISPSHPRNSIDGQAALGQIWQQGYHDYLLISRQMIDSTERYIAYNPLKWSVMYDSKEMLRIKEPLSSPRLDCGDYWKGVGNIDLLSPEEKLVSLRVSRSVDSPIGIKKVVERMERAVDKGYVIISGFISKGERAVRDMLCARKDAKFIRILPSCIPNRKFKPESVYVAPFAENRYLEIARGNDETEFGRSACLDLNAEIIDIATAAKGLAIYWKSDGVHIVGEGV